MYSDNIPMVAYLRHTLFMAIMTKEGSTKIINFMIKEARVLVLGLSHISHIVQLHYFFKNILLLFCLGKTTYVCGNDDQGSTKGVNYMSPRTML